MYVRGQSRADTSRAMSTLTGAQLLTSSKTRFIGPCSAHVSNRVASTTEEEQGQAKAFHEFNTVGMPTHRQIEAANLIASQRVRAALQYHSRGLVVLHDRCDDRLKYALVALVGDAVPQGKIDRVILALAKASVAQLACTRKELAVFVKTTCHDTIRRVEGFLDTVAMMDVDVDVEHPGMIPKQLEDTKNDV